MNKRKITNVCVYKKLNKFLLNNSRKSFLESKSSLSPKPPPIQCMTASISLISFTLLFR